MVVKKQNGVQNSRQMDLNALANNLQLMNEQSHFLPSPIELIRQCREIVSCLARTHDSQHGIWGSLQIVEGFLLRVINSVDAELRHGIITGVIEKFNQYTSDPKSGVGAVTSIVLVVLSLDIEESRAVARWLVQQREFGGGMRTTLGRLYSWMYRWDGTRSLADWVMSLIKALEENERFDVLFEVTIENLGDLFSMMANPSSLRQSSADVILHVLASLRESKEALCAVSPIVERVFTELTSDSGQFSRQILQNLVDILTCMVQSLNAREEDISNYNNVIMCLDQHMARGSEFIHVIPWSSKNVNSRPTTSGPAIRKVGLMNLGNTCYMNSVMQALLLTRQFSTQVMTRMLGMPYWSRMGFLFAKMMHSISTQLNPLDVFKVIKPPFFNINNQHDSSEFLGYLLELLQSFENASERNFDYSRPAGLAASMRLRNAGQSTSSEIEYDVSTELSLSEILNPDNGILGSPSGSNKRPCQDLDDKPPIKRMRIIESVHLRRSSVIDNMFGGILLTRMDCVDCDSTSLSRDVFRDLQLAFPDKPEGWQHSVQSLLEFYCSTETLSGDNRYHCHECGGLRDAERSVLIECAPKYLILVLKNFKFDPKLNVQTKLMHRIFYNQTVTLPAVLSKSLHSTYNMYAAVIHSGTTLDSGHYYTIAKDGDSWYTFNDEQVEPTNENQLQSLPRGSTPYILFYKRTDVDEGPVPALKDLPRRLREYVMSHNKPYVGVRHTSAHISRPS